MISPLSPFFAGTQIKTLQTLNVREVVESSYHSHCKPLNPFSVMYNTNMRTTANGYASKLPTVPLIRVAIAAETLQDIISIYITGGDITVLDQNRTRRPSKQRESANLITVCSKIPDQTQKVKLNGIEIPITRRLPN